MANKVNWAPVAINREKTNLHTLLDAHISITNNSTQQLFFCFNTNFDDFLSLSSDALPLLVYSVSKISMA